MDTFKYLGKILDRPDYNWSEVRWNVRKAHQVWIQVGKILRREGTYPRVSEMFYQSVVHSVLLFGADTWYFWWVF